MKPSSENNKFWQRKNLFELTQKEWESLCDGCGKCCLHKIEDEDTGEYFGTRVHCKLFDPRSCRCQNYRKRRQIVRDCVVLTPKKVYQLEWLPKTCAYRLLSEGQDLYDWHPLVSGNPDSVHRAGISVKGKNLVSEETAGDLANFVDHSLS